VKRPKAQGISFFFYRLLTCAALFENLGEFGFVVEEVYSATEVVKLFVVHSSWFFFCVAVPATAKRLSRWNDIKVFKEVGADERISALYIIAQIGQGAFGK